jgi:hypothetical protein
VTDPRPPAVDSALNINWVAPEKVAVPATPGVLTLDIIEPLVPPVHEIKVPKEDVPPETPLPAVPVPDPLPPLPPAPTVTVTVPAGVSPVIKAMPTPPLPPETPVVEPALPLPPAPPP